jgi:hypothetical protein
MINGTICHFDPGRAGKRVLPPPRQGEKPVSPNARADWDSFPPGWFAPSGRKQAPRKTFSSEKDCLISYPRPQPPVVFLSLRPDALSCAGRHNRSGGGEQELRGRSLPATAHPEKKPYPKQASSTFALRLDHRSPTSQSLSGTARITGVRLRLGDKCHL